MRDVGPNRVCTSPAGFKPTASWKANGLRIGHHVDSRRATLAGNSLRVFHEPAPDAGTHPIRLDEQSIERAVVVAEDLLVHRHERVYCGLVDERSQLNAGWRRHVER